MVTLIAPKDRKGVLVQLEIINMNKYNQILSEAFEKIDSSNDLHTLLLEIKPKFLGKNGVVTNLLSEIKNMTKEEKRISGKDINDTKIAIESKIVEKVKYFQAQELQNRMTSELIDGTAPERKFYKGSLHPITKSCIEAVEILKKFGFEPVTGPEVEEEFFNFTALNIGAYHPARQMQDTFYLTNPNYLLRTQTTSVDIRTIINKNNPNAKKPPLALLSYGKVFRVESDRTHSPMFHQLEGLMIAEKLNMGHLRYYLESFLREFFETDIVLKFRPSFFPFTEPSAEVDIGYKIENDKIIIGGDSNFLEVLGCGMLHENVLRNCNIDPEKYSAIAFGCGLDRLVMLKYGMKDIRKFTASNLEWLRHYSFNFTQI
jgi:phenylalanyl-tRNA synthetase alpha chain